MNVLIIEDEAPAARRLVNLIKEVDHSINILGIIQRVKEGIKWFKNNPAPDLIFSDIQLADDLSFKIFSVLEIKTPVIFTTAYDEYAIKAFKYHSVDYLLKPIKKEEIQQSIFKFKDLQTQIIHPDFKEIINSLKISDHKNRFLVYFKDTLMPITCKEISYFLSEDGVSFIVKENGDKFIIKDTLDQLEKCLNPKHFFRVNRQYIVSLKAILKIHPYFNQKLKLIIQPKTEKEVLVSKLKATAFKNWLNK